MTKRSLSSIGLLLVGVAAAGWVSLRWYAQISLEHRQTKLDSERLHQQELARLQKETEDQTEQQRQQTIIIYRRQCHQDAERMATEDYQETLKELGLNPKPDFYLKNAYEFRYKNCLNYWGIGEQ